MLCRSLAAAALIAAISSPCYALHAPSSSILPKAPASVHDSRFSASMLKPASKSGDRAMALRGGAATASEPWYAPFWNETVELGVLFGLWYWGNVYYNIYNKKALNDLGGAKGGLVWTVSMLQLFIGVLWVLPLWALGIRQAPKMTSNNWAEIVPVGIFSAGAHAGSVLGLGAGAVSFAQILKACEPAFSAVNEVIFLGEVQAWQVYITLIPIIGGVALASLGELSFSWLAVIACMIANQCAALKAVTGKGVMKQAWAKSMGAANQYGIVNIASWLTLLPIALFVEGPKAKASFDKYVAVAPNKKKDILFNTLASGFAFYLYNEVSFMALNKVSPVTHSVANTLKRVVIIVVSCIVFKTKMTTESIVGSTVAITGTLLYSLAKNKYSGGH